MQIDGAYEKLRPLMGTGDIIEWRSNSLIGRLIRSRTGQNVNHTSMVIQLTQYDTQRVFVLEALENGIVLNLLSRRLRDFDGMTFWSKLKCQFSGYRVAIGRAALDKVGVPYDYGSLIRQLFARVSADARRLFCSEYVFVVLREAGLPVRGHTAPWPGEMDRLGVYDESICFG